MIVLKKNSKKNSVVKKTNLQDIFHGKYNRIKNILEKNYAIDNVKSTEIVNILFILSLIKHLNINYSKINNWLKYLFNVELNNFSEEDLVSNLDNVLLIYNLEFSYSEKVKLYKLLESINFDKIEKEKITINDVLGKVFEKIITKKEIGAYYTSDLTTEYITNNSILASLIKTWSTIDTDLNFYLKQFELNNKISFIEYQIKNNIELLKTVEYLINKFDEIKFLKVLKKIKIIDISCGSGSFIFYSFKLLSKLNDLVKKDEKKSYLIFYENLYGIDIDPEAISILKFRIFIELLIKKELDNSPIYFDDNYIIGNSLLNNDSESRKNSIFFKNKKIKDILNDGGFDVVLGNPPYLEYRNVKNKYQVKSFMTEKCNNLYAFILEKNLNILKENGHLGMIVPISYTSTKRMTTVRNLFTENSVYQFCSNYADRPSSLFNGVHQKLNIILLEKKSNNQKSNLYTTSYIHWYKEEKDTIFSNISYVKNDFNTNDYFFKIGNSTEKEIIKKLCFNNNESLLPNQKLNFDYKIWLNMRMCFWNKSFTYIQNSNEYKVFNFKTEKHSILFSALLNSNIFFFFWECISDVWHITLKELNELKLNFDDVSEDDLSKIKEVYFELELFLENHKKMINSKQTAFEYQHKKAKHLIDKLDLLFAKYFFLEDDEIEYLKNYQLKFRMNNELKKYLK